MLLVRYGQLLHHQVNISVLYALIKTQMLFVLIKASSSRE